MSFLRDENRHLQFLHLNLCAPSRTPHLITSSDPHFGQRWRLLIFWLLLIRWNAFHLISIYCRILTNYKDFANQKWQLYHFNPNPYKEKESHITATLWLSLWCHQESNRGHKDFQSFALPSELWHPTSVQPLAGISWNGSANIGGIFESAKFSCKIFNRQSQRASATRSKITIKV